MPRTYQIIPEHLYPHQHVVINDNTVYSNLPSPDVAVRTLCVFASPKGIDGKIQSIRGSDFLKKYGLGPFSLYGQPLLNAYNSAKTDAAVLHCLRVTAPDATYSTLHLVGQYKMVETGVEPAPIVTTMHIRFIAKAGDPITDLDMLEDAYTVPEEPAADGYTEVKLLSVAYLGKGSWGDNIRMRVSSFLTGDRENKYKNHTFEIYENDKGLMEREKFNVVFGTEDAIIDDISLFSDSVVNDPESGSEYVTLKTYTDGFAAIVDAYNAEFTTSVLTIDDFDVFLGIDKNTRTAITKYTIDTTSSIEGLVAMNDLAGIPLRGGSDGSLSSSTSATVREAALEAAYTAAFTGITDAFIKSKNKFPTTLILDANYPVDVKILLATLQIKRSDCVVILDCGTGIVTKESIIPYVETNLDPYVINRTQMIDAYAGKIKDPFSKKIVTVTGTYALAALYPIHFQRYEGKHVPLAGNNFGELSGFIRGSIYPVFDEDIDSDLMDTLCEERINFARLNAKGDIIRATQTTRQKESSNLSEANNVFILLDIKRDCERLCATYEYNFSESRDIVRFNNDAETLLGRYREAQVRSIKAMFAKTAWEAERGILHLYVEFVNKDIVKTTIIEIDVNR